MNKIPFSQPLIEEDVVASFINLARWHVWQAGRSVRIVGASTHMIKGLPSMVAEEFFTAIVVLHQSFKLPGRNVKG